MAAGFVPNEYRAVLLEALAGRTTVTLGAVYLGLALSLPTDPITSTLATLVEVTTAGYARKAIPGFPAASTVAPIQIVQTAAFSFNALTADMVTPAYYAFITDAAAGTAGKIRYIFELPEPQQGRSGEALLVPASALVIE